MQITETAIAQSTVSDGPPILRVTFQGQGGDCVTVDMANVESLAGEPFCGDRARKSHPCADCHLRCCRQ
ncbi:hypothetical protein [Hoeflea sp. 108]|uniref:hypothetical protein n=1 Tax=Hoeflea sp. 108 TaxID=1116369 RepID=UPI0012FA990D|nr:hypothetical protein [Hoeflea sp. 108]